MVLHWLRWVIKPEKGVELLFVGDDWGQAHHDVELMDAAGRRLAKARLPEGVVGMAGLQAMIGEQLGEDTNDEVVVGIETDQGPWVAALIAARYTVFAISSLQVARYRQRHCVSGAGSDAGDAHTLADMARTDSHQLRLVAGDTAQAQAVKVATRAHKTLIWERTRPIQRLRHALRDYFPAALEAFEDVDAADAMVMPPPSTCSYGVRPRDQTPIYDQLRGEHINADVPTTGPDPQRVDHHGNHRLLTDAPVATVVFGPPGPGADLAANQHHPVRIYPAGQPAGHGQRAAAVWAPRAALSRQPRRDKHRHTPPAAPRRRPQPATTQQLQCAAADDHGTHLDREGDRGR